MLLTLKKIDSVSKAMIKIVSIGIVGGISLQPVGKQFIFSSNNINGRELITAAKNFGIGQFLNQEAIFNR